MLPNAQSQTLRTVVGFDFSDQAHLALARCIRMCSEVARGEVHVVSALGHRVNATFPKVDHSYRGAEDIRKRLRAITDAEVARVEPNHLTVYVHARIGEPADTILQVAAEVAADMIIVGTHSKSGLERWVLGSVSETIVRRASCPVVVVRETNYDSDWSLQHLPEPPCPRCLERRRATSGRDWWCDVHADHENPYERPSFGVWARDQNQLRQQAWVLY